MRGKSALSAISWMNKATSLSSGIVGERGMLKKVLLFWWPAKEIPSSVASFWYFSINESTLGWFAYNSSRLVDGSLACNRFKR